MIRKLEEDDISEVLKIWLDSNVEVHNFISRDFWFDNLHFVESALSQSEVYISLYNNSISGFIGLNNDLIEGLFVDSKYRSKGVGKRLLDYIKLNHHLLKLNVYVKNIRAIDFYKRNAFIISRKFIDELTGEDSYEMIWSKL